MAYLLNTEVIKTGERNCPVCHSTAWQPEESGGPLWRNSGRGLEVVAQLQARFP